MRVRIGLFLLFGLLLQGGLASAQTTFKEGLQYNLIKPQPAAREGDEVEVVEFFWYGCPHCNSLEPYVHDWLKTKPANIRFVRMPAPFSGKALMHAKAFYALQLMGEGERLHQLIFDAMHKKKLKLATLDEMVAFLKAHGVDEQKFRAALDSFAVQTQMNRTSVLARRYGIRSVPTLVIDGRYRSGKGFTSYGEFTELAEHLAAKVLKDRQSPASNNQ